MLEKEKYGELLTKSDNLKKEYLQYIENFQQQKEKNNEEIQYLQETTLYKEKEFTLKQMQIEEDLLKYELNLKEKDKEIVFLQECIQKQEKEVEKYRIETNEMRIK